MKPIFILTMFLWTSSILLAQKNLTFRDSIQYSVLLNDVWGYSAGGNEYALVGLQNGVSIVNVSDPDSIFEAFFISDSTSTWRDLKTWSTYAYVTNETGGGLLIIDLSGLPGSISSSHYTGAGLLDAHNLYIDENGIAYIFGSNVGIGGALFLDLVIPNDPDSIGIYNSAYLHDGFVRGDTLYGAEINDGRFSVIDVSNKSSPTILATQTTPDTLTHNIWPSDDANYVYTTDEKSSAYVVAYDISNLSSITEVDKYQSNPGSGVIPHNVHVLNDYLVTSYYRDGLTIVDADRPHNIVEVGNYDTHPLSGNGFNGDWGVYPFLPSANILVSDRSEGLFVLTPTYVRGCYLEGTVRNSGTNAFVPDVAVSIINSGVNESTDTLGEYKMGYVDSGYYNLSYSLLGFHTKNISNVLLDNGIVTILDILLIPSTVITCNVTAAFTVADTNLCVGDTLVFTNTSTNSINYEWYVDSIFLNQDTNLTIAFNDTGSFACMLIADKGVCQDTAIQTIAVSGADTITWTGTTDSVYNRASNWSGNSVPGRCDVAVISGTNEAVNQPVISSSGLMVKELVIQTDSGAVLQITGSGHI
ncbi:MAG: choice-of-anchor B family protein, partial [Bacteroidetes bacterium]|nr:choice-of-anchor B family protein [Bacteroidota bacterium]